MRLPGKQDRGLDGAQDRRNDYRRYLKKCPEMLSLCDSVFQKDPQKDIFAADCIYTAIPVLQSYLAWVLERAERKQIRRLYFLARDGYLMCRMARHLAEKMQFDIECRYLYASRYAWRIPAYHILKDSALDYICRDGMNVTFRKVLERSGISMETTTEITKILGMEKQMQERLSRRQLREMKQQLAGCGMFMERLEETSRNAYGITAGYLEQEGLLDEIEWAVVDSGWTGSLQDMLQQLLYERGYRKIVKGFYFGLYSLPAKAKYCNYEWFYFGPYGGATKKAGFCNNLFECMYSAPHGMTLGYKKTDSRIVPVFSKQIKKNCAKIQKEEALLESYLEQWNLQERKIPLEYLKRKQIRYLFNEFMGKPCKEEAMCWGTFLFSDDVTENILRPLAEIMETKELWGMDLWPRLTGKLVSEETVKKNRESAWEEGSIALTESRFAGWHRANVKCYRYLLAVRTGLNNRRKDCYQRAGKTAE